MKQSVHAAIALLTTSCIVTAVLLVVFVLVPAGAVTGADDVPAIYDVPRVEGVAVDGDEADWGGGGFCVDHIAAPDGSVRPVEDFDVRFRLGWNGEGLLVLVTVIDDVAWEAPDRLWRFDCVELFVAERAGSGNFYQVIITSGADPEFGAMRRRIFDKRPEDQREPAELAVEAASRIVEGGYIIEALLPWKNLGIEPAAGTELAFQLVAADDDGTADPPGGAIREAWYPSIRSHENPGMLHSIRLAEAPGEPVRYRLGRVIDLTGATVSMRGVAELVDMPYLVYADGTWILRGKLEPEGGRAGTTFRVNGDEDGMAPEITVEVFGAGKRVVQKLPIIGHILDRCVEAMGGAAALERLKTRTCAGKLTHDYPNADRPLWSAPAEAYSVDPGKWAVVLHYESGDVWFGCDGETGWVRDADGFRRHDRSKRTPLEPFLDPRGILHLDDYFGGLLLEEQMEFENGRAFYVARSKDPERPARIHFDAASGLLTKVGAWSFTDYREVDGVMFPFRFTAERRGGKSYYEFSEVRHNEPVDDVEFSIPEGTVDIRDPFAGIEDTLVLPMLKHLPYKHGGMSVPPQDGRLLYNLIVDNGYKRGLEIGTSNGYSALWLGLAFRKTGGSVITIEIEEPSGREAQANFERAVLDDVIDARIADAFTEIPAIEGSFDFVFIDAWKPDYIKFLELVRDRVTPGGAITAHNVASHERDMEAFLEALAADPGLETTIHRISESGLSVSIVKK